MCNIVIVSTVYYSSETNKGNWVGGNTIKTFTETLKRNNQKFLLVLLIFLVLSTVATVANVFMVRITGDMSQAALDLDTTALFNLLAVITGLMALQAASAALSALLLGRFSARVGYRFRDNFARYFLRLPFSELEKDSSGASLSIYSNDLPQAVAFVSRGGLQMVADFITLIVSFVFMLTINLWFTLLFFGMFPLLVVMQVVISNPIQRKSIKMSEEQANFNAIVNDSLQNVSTIAAYSLEDVLKRRYLGAYDKFFDAVRDFIKSMSTMVIAGIAVTLAPILVISVMSAASVINGNMSFAEFIAFTSLAFQAGSWLMMLSQRLTNVQVNAAGAKRLSGHMSACLNMEVEKPIASFKPTSADNVAVKFSGVSFSYGAGEQPAEPQESAKTDDIQLPVLTMALSEVDLEIPRGAKVAFVGGSGSGKSTVLKLMLGLYTPTAGEVKIFGQKELIGAFAYVPQDSFLFPESIGSNITGTETPDAAKLEAACRDAGIWDFINSLPDKFDGVLAESADNVSGGQKQRIALARAFYQDAPIILFDEATSALDPTTEAEVLKSFETTISHNPDKTVIMVAHRPRAIAFCDTIVVMENGKIVATGSHEHLLATCPEYARLEVTTNAN